MKRILFLAAAAAPDLNFLQKDETVEYNPSVKAPLTVEFDNVAGSNDLQLATGTYTNAAGEDFTLTKLKYYISNIKLTRTNGTEYVVPQNDSYFMVDESDEATHEAELSVPEGEYETVQFLVGVDSLRSTMDVSQRTGVLDPSGAGADMYWTWNSGYIFFQNGGNLTRRYWHGKFIHVSYRWFRRLFCTTINNIKTVTLDLSTHENT